LVNIGCGIDISIKELAELIVAEVGYEGELVFDTTKPDGTLRKLMDTGKLNLLGWEASINLLDGIKQTIREVQNLAGVREQFISEVGGGLNKETMSERRF
jgi:GDP-L-fucose synthase